MYPKVSTPKRQASIKFKGEEKEQLISSTIPPLFSPRHESHPHLPKYKARKKKLSKLFKIMFSGSSQPKRHCDINTNLHENELKRQEMSSLAPLTPPTSTTPEELSIININNSIDKDECSNVQELSAKENCKSRLSSHEERKSKLPVRKASIATAGDVDIKQPPSMIQVLFQSGKKVVSKIPVPNSILTAYKDSKKVQKKKTERQLTLKGTKKVRGNYLLKPRLDANNNSNARGCILQTPTKTNTMGNKPTRIKDRTSSIDNKKAGKISTKKGLKIEERSDSKWKPGRGKKTLKKDKKTPVINTVSNEYSTANNSSEALFKAAVIALLPDNKTYNDDGNILKAFDELIHEWKKEYSQKSIATEALAVVIKHLNLKNEEDKDTLSDSLCNAKIQELSYCRRMLSLLTTEETPDASDDDYDVHKQLEDSIIQVQTENLQLKEELNGIKSRSSPALSLSGDTPSHQCSKCKDVSAEIESLGIVLDMKNKEVQKLNVERMKLLQKFEKYYELEKKYEMLSRESEAMSAVLESKSKFERQLSVERDSLAIDLEKKSRKVAQLSMEKEELLWKASNSTIGSHSPDISFHRLSHPPLNNFMSSSPVVNNSEKPLRSPTHCSFTIQEN